MDFFSNGFGFPVRPDEQTGEMASPDYTNDIAQSVMLIVKTNKGERVMNPEFGADMNRFLYENISLTLLKDIEDEIFDAVTRWEPRISNLEVDASPGQSIEASIDIEIKYVVILTGRRENISLVHELYNA